MDKSNIEHISIRDPSYVAGSNTNPEVGVFVQTHRQHSAINENILYVGQTVWMKWSGGPIVAKSELLSWHTGTFENGNINEIRDKCVGQKLFGLNSYWEHVSNKLYGHYAVILLKNEQWLDPIYPKSSSFGSSWIYIDTEDKRKIWLSNDQTQQLKHNDQTKRSIPKGIRFDVLKRDEFTCCYCGGKAPEVQLHVDHVIPFKIVKEHKIENLITACADCNLGKSDKIL